MRLIRKDSKLGVRGVCQQTPTRFVAYFSKDKKKHHVGCFRTLEEARKASEKARAEAFVDHVPYKRPIIPIEQRFWAAVRKSADPAGCWEWTRGTTLEGYGLIGVSRNRNILAHRFSYALHYGAITPDSLFVCHKCDNPHCVRPDHLFLGTQKDNMQDAIAKGRPIGRPKTKRLA